MEHVQEVLARCQAAYYRLIDYHGVLRREVGEATLAPRQDTIEVVFRKPAFLSLRWQGGLYKGARLLSNPTRNKGQMTLRLGQWFDFVTVSVPGTEVGEPFVPGLKDISEWLSALTALAQRPSSDRSLRLIQVRTVDPALAEGRVILSVPAFLVPFRDNAVATYEFVVERGTGVPDELVLRGVGGEVQQRLTYTDLQVNVGVPLQAFTWEDGSGDPPDGPYGTVMINIRRFMQNWRWRYASIADYVGVWIVTERRGQRCVRRRALFKFRKPFELYLRWEGAERFIEEALFRQGWNGGRIRVRATLWGIPLIGDLAAHGRLARQELPSAVPAFGLQRVVEELQEQFLRGWLSEEVEVGFGGVQEYEDRPSYVLEFAFAQNQARDYRYSRIVVFWDIAWRVPVVLRAYDWTGEMHEEQQFQRLEFNVSLDNRDFEANNPAYGFLLLRTIPLLDAFLTGRK